MPEIDPEGLIAMQGRVKPIEYQHIARAKCNQIRLAQGANLMLGISKVMIALEVHVVVQVEK